MWPSLRSQWELIRIYSETCCLGYLRLLCSSDVGQLPDWCHIPRYTWHCLLAPCIHDSIRSMVLRSALSVTASGAFGHGSPGDGYYLEASFYSFDQAFASSSVADMVAVCEVLWYISTAMTVVSPASLIWCTLPVVDMPSVFLLVAIFFPESWFMPRSLKKKS